MNLKDMEYFYYLCKLKSFTKTAEKLYVSQPSITMALKRIEKELNTKLVIRNHSEKQIELTEAGMILKRHTQNIIEEIKEIKLEISKISGGNIKLGVPPMIGAYFFPIIMEELAKQGYARNIELVEKGSVAMKELLLTNEVDMSLIGSLYPLKEENLEAKILKVDEFKVCMSKNHVLAKKTKIDFKELLNEQFIVLGNSYIHNEVLEKLCMENNISMKNFYYTEEIQTAKSLIASGVGIGIMIDMAVNNIKTIKTVPILKPIKFYISFASKKDRYLTLNEEKIKEIILNNSNKTEYIFNE